MAQIDLPLLPPRLFRYRDVGTSELADRELGAIRENYLWFSVYRSLNDPMEGFYGASPWLAKQTNFKLVANEIYLQKRNIGICCFSDTNDNELMWAHYARNASGICIGYSTAELLRGLDDSIHVVRVAYNGAPPRIGKAYKDTPQGAARAVLSHKKTCWLYEREWRLLTNPTDKTPIPGRIQISQTAAKVVYIGARVSTDVRSMLENELGHLGIQAYAMKVSGYDQRWEQITSK